jgi:hypothetical protein
MVALGFIATAIASAALLLQTSTAHSIKRNPVDYLTLVENVNIRAPSHRVNAHSKFDLIFTLHDGQQEIRLSLEPNHDILHQNFTVTRMDKSGRTKSVDKIDRLDHKVYKGSTFVRRGSRNDWRNTGWARILVHRDGVKPLFDGVFRIDGITHHVQLGKAYQRLRHEEDFFIDLSGGLDAESMVVWRDSDVRSFGAAHNDHTELRREITNDTRCAADDLEFNSRYDEKLRDLRSLDTRSLFGRQNIDGGGGTPSGNLGTNLLNSIGSSAGCPSTSKVALVGIATDCNYWESFDENEEELRKNVITFVNAASEVFESTFSISLGLQNLNVIDARCTSTQSDGAPWNLACGQANINDRLSLFSQWRGDTRDTNAFWSLLTTCNTASAVGLAWRGELCRQGADEQDENGQTRFVSSANVVVRTDTEWQIFAHETGHTFGAVHDCSDETCPTSSDTELCCPDSRNSCNANGQYIMHPATGRSMTTFSPCSLGNICSGLGSLVNEECLTDNRNIDLIEGSQCGNGIVETGEDCDCGGDESCDANSCCDPDTCQYRDGAVCDPSNEDCCTDQCQFASLGSVCRESNGDCDPEETCPGNSATCPEDNHVDDGSSCGDDDEGLSCASGQCTSRSLQCRNTVSSLGSSNRASDCDSYDQCRITCSAPEFGGSCTAYNSNFLDGTSCGAAGRCNNGSCDGQSVWAQITQWIQDNLEIFIPVVSVVGILVLAAIGSCILSCFRRRRRTRAVKASPPNVSSPNWHMSGAQQVPPPQASWHNQNPYPGSPGPIQPVHAPPPQYGYGPPMPHQGQQQWLQRAPTQRYA